MLKGKVLVPIFLITFLVILFCLYLENIEYNYNIFYHLTIWQRKEGLMEDLLILKVYKKTTFFLDILAMFIETLGDLYRLLSTFYYVGNGYLDFINNINIYIFILFILSILLKTKIYTNIIRFIYKLINIHSFVFFLFLLVMLLYKKENYCTIIEQILYFFCINNFINYKDHIMLIEFFILIYFLIFTITKKMLKNIIKDYIKHCIYIVFLYIGFILLIIIYGLIIVDGFGSSYEIDVLGDTAIFFYLFFINYFYQISFIFLFRKLSKDLILKLKNYRLN